MKLALVAIVACFAAGIAVGLRTAHAAPPPVADSSRALAERDATRALDTRLQLRLHKLAAR